MEKLLSSKWLDKAFTIALAIATVILTQSLVSKRDYDKQLRDDLNNRPTKDVFNKEIGNLREYVNTQDTNNQNMLKQHIEDEKKTDERMLNLFQSMDGKINILIGRNK